MKKYYFNKFVTELSSYLLNKTGRFFFKTRQKLHNFFFKPNSGKGVKLKIKLGYIFQNKDKK